MKKEQLAPMAKEINRVLKDKNEEDILQELETLVNEYGVNVDDAMRSIVRKFGGNVGQLSLQGGRMTIAEITGSEQSLDLLARIVYISKRMIGKDGDREIVGGILGDDTGTIPFTVWEPEGFDLEKGEVLLIRDAYAKEWNDEAQVNLGNRATWERKNPTELPMPERMPAQEVKVTDLKEGMRSVIITGRLVDVEQRTINLEAGPKTVISGVLADETGKVQFTDWSEHELQTGMGVRIENAYVRAWRGIPQLNFGEYATVVTDDGLPPVTDLVNSEPRPISDLESSGGGFDIVIRGTVLEIKRGSGLIQRCPECHRMVQKNECMVHGKVEANYDLRIKAVVDDGTGAMTVIMGQDITKQLAGIDLARAQEMAQEAMDMEVDQEFIEERLIARPVEVQGNASSDEYGMMLIASRTELMSRDTMAGIEALVAKLEGSV